MEKGKRPKDIKQAYRVSYLLASYVKQTLTKTEQEELDAWINESDHNRQMFSELTDPVNVKSSLHDYHQPDPEDYMEQSKQDLQFNKPTKRLNIVPLLIAASIILAVVLTLYFKPFSKQGSKREIVRAGGGIDILPGIRQAVLSYANGKKITLQSTGTDTIVDKALSIHTRDGELIYSDLIVTGPEYHTLTVPRKGFYKLRLPDGSIAWLNAESSIRYPVSFTGNERRVVISGEVYFEVAHNTQKPFRIETGSIMIEDIGTSFDVNSYGDEGIIATTLVEGSIKVVSSGHEQIIRPGEQLKITQVGNSSIVTNVDVAEITGWKDGQFKFVNTPLAVIMRQVARWYDAEIIFQDPVNVHLNATIERNVPVSKLLYLLSKTDDVHFKIDGNRIIVMK